ncbi:MULTISPECIES: AMP-binding protein [Glaesserella]|uniref:AMP-binding protein n=1 Tax=Glaesserella australis TaxID=2094024 RepID=A0A328C2F6_9PAST|nr:MULTISPECIES: AMP-binding protein [Glaesserella]AUI66521.1 AMP-binding protein [Glaesserella sp. 15-184]RAL18694.1 AMP-binding protein [Glaesserella australis]
MKNCYLPESAVAHFPTWTYSDFEQRALQISAYLQQQGTKAIAVWLEDGANLACTLLACWHANVKVLFPLNDTPESVEWAHQYADFWLVDSENPNPAYQLFSQLALDFPLQKIDRNRPLVDLHNQTELWFNASDSTGETNIIVKTAEEMWLSAEVLANELSFPASNEITAISSVSIQHLYGLTVHIMMSLIQGWVIGRKQLLSPECIMAESQKSTKIVLVSSPAMLSCMDWQSISLPKVAGIISSGSALDPDISYTIYQQADAVEIYPNGFELLGRIDRIVKIGDKRTSLVSVEQALVKHEWIDDCYIGKHPEQQRLAAWVGVNSLGIQAFRDQGRKYVVEQLKSHLAQSQEKTAIPRFWRFTDKLPRNSQSKISRLEFDKICVTEVLDPIWSSREIQENLQILRGKVPLDLHFFKGHFANFPLVPGVIELQWTQDQITHFFGKEKAILRIDNLKYQKFLRPNDEFELILKWEATKNRMGFQLKTDGEMCGSGLFIFHDE